MYWVTIHLKMTRNYIKTHRHRFLQKNMVTFLGKGHGWILHIQIKNLSNGGNILENTTTARLQNFRRNATVVTLWRYNHDKMRCC